MRIPRAISTVLPPFILTRGFILAIFVIVPCVTSQQVDSLRELSLHRVGIVEALHQTLNAGDAVYYQSIAERGYQSTTWEFFPAYPILVSLFHLDFYLTGAIISNLLFLIAMSLLAYVGKEFGLSEEQSQRAIWYLAIFPASYFFSMALTESLFLCLMLLSVYFALKNRWWLAGMVGAVSSATRVTGVILLVLLGLLYFRRQEVRRDALSLLLVPIGLVTFMAYAWANTGDPLAFIHAQSALGRNTSGVFLLRPLIEFVVHPRGFEGWQFAPLSFAVAVLVFFCIYKLVRQKEWALAAYSFAAITVPLSTGTMTSIPRYMAVMFPIYLVLARLEHEQVIAYIFTALLALLTVFCALHYTFALA